MRLASVATSVILARSQAHFSTADSTGITFPSGDGGIDCKMSDWTPSEACNAAGFKTETRYVVVEPSNGGSLCPPTEFTTPCSEMECWMGPWSDWVCDSTGVKQRTREIALSGLQDPSRCPATEERAACDPIPCVINSLEDDAANPWGDCALEDGVWIKTKTLEVKSPAQYGGQCFAPTHPMRLVTMPCTGAGTPNDCIVTPVDQNYSVWGECSETSPNVWTRNKTLGFQTPVQPGGLPCPNASHAVVETCLPQDCMWNTTEYDAWTDCDASDIQYHPFKITQQPLYGGLPCPPVADRSDMAFCSVDCAMSEWVATSDCAQDPETGIWQRTLTRNVTTQPLHDGSQCGELTTTETCQAVDCQFAVDTTWCTLDANNHWVRSSGGITITTPALYGGAACPSTPPSCDWENHCGPLTDAAEQTRCTQALTQAEPFLESTGWASAAYPMDSPTAWGCTEICAATTGCRGFSYWAAFQTCWLQMSSEYVSFSYLGTVATKMIPQLPVVSDVCKYERYTIFDGVDLPDQPEAASSGAECCERCKDTPKCKAFAFNFVTKDCALKTAFTDVIVDYSYSSGVVIGNRG